MRRLAVVLLVVALGAIGWVAHGLTTRPSLEPWAAARLPASGPPVAGREVTVTFLGVSSLLFDDGETAIMTDGFFTRPGLAAVLFERLVSDPALVTAGLDRAGVRRLSAVLVTHSHYDHALDAAEVARRTGAVLVGSESALNIGRGAGLPESGMRRYANGDTIRFGAFEVTPVLSRHFPHGRAMGDITAPLAPPARASAYLDGGSWSLVIRHPLGSAVVQASAGWVDGALAGRHADVLFLGVAGLGTKGPDYHDCYYREVVQAVDPRVVVPIHWDDFTLPLADPPPPMPVLLDDVPGSLAFLAQRLGKERQLLLPHPWERVRLFPLDARR